MEQRPVYKIQNHKTPIRKYRKNIFESMGQTFSEIDTKRERKT